MTHFKPPSRHAGLTLIELLVAMLMVSILFVAVYRIFNLGLTTSMETSTRAELDTETQKVQQLMVNRIKEADRFVASTAVTFQDTQSAGQAAYLPASTLSAQQIVVVRLPSKNSPDLCDLYAYYVVPSADLANVALPIQRRLAQATPGAVSLIEGKNASPFQCTSSTYPAISQLRLLHPSLRSNTGFVVNAYSIAGVQKGVVFSLQGHRQAGSRTITAHSYQVKVLARNL